MIMHPFLEFALKAMAALPVIVIFVSYFFRLFVFPVAVWSHLQSFFIGVLVTIPALFLQWFLDSLTAIEVGPFLKAFVFAAFTEELIRFLVVFATIRMAGSRFTIIAGLLESVLIGSGFAFAENLYHAASSSYAIILLRGFSTIPLHIIAAAVMGFHLSRMELSRSRRGRIPAILQPNTMDLFLAIFLPWLLHGLYDYALFLGGNATYLVPFIALFGVIYIVYQAEGAVGLYSRDLLRILEIDVHDQRVIQMQKLYEGWINDFESWKTFRATLFHRAGSLAGYLSAGILFLLAALYPVLVFVKGPDILPGVFLYEGYALLTLLPAVIGLFLLVSEHINFQFYREFFMRYPAGAILEMETSSTSTESIVLLDYYATGLFLTARAGLEVGSEVRIIFPGKRNAALGTVRWVNASDESLPIGSMISLDRYSYRLLPVFFRHMLIRMKHRFLASREFG